MARYTYPRRKGYRTRRTQRKPRRRFSTTTRRVSRRLPGRYALSFRNRFAPLGGFPPIKHTTLRYVETVTLNPGNGSSAVNVFAVNNIFDPNVTGSGHQPMYYDNYAALYSRYRVTSATCTFIPLSNHITNTTTAETSLGTTTGANQFFSSNERACRLFILIDKSPTDYPSDLDNLIEEGNKRLKWRFVPQTTSPTMQKLTVRADPARMQNLSRKDDGLQSSFGAGPGYPLYFICGVDSMDTFNADSMSYQVIITYRVTFSDFIGNQTQN